MPNWKKLIVSGSDAHLNSLDIATFVSASNFAGDGSGITGVISSSYSVTASYVDFDSVDNKPTLISSSVQIASEISGSITAFSSSITDRVVSLENFSSSLNATFATDAELSAVSSSIASDIADIIDGTTTVTSASYALTASYALNAGGADTGSLLTTASAAGSTITFEKGDGSTFDVTVSATATPANALVTASLAGSTLTFEKGDTSTFSIVLPAGGGGGYTGESATAILSQSVAADTWSFAHNLNERHPVVTVYDENEDVIVPNVISTVDENNLEIVFSTARTGYATAVVVGVSSSYAATASYSDNFNAVSASIYALSASFIDFDLNPTTEPQEGRLVWNADDGTLDLGLGNATLQIGQEQYWYVRNNTASPIANGAAVMATGTLGASTRLTAAPMVADGTVPAKFFLGVATQEIPAGEDGYVTTFGKVRNINTSSYPTGSVLWCDPDNPGGLTITEPTAPSLKLPVAFTISSTNNGSIAVRATTGVRLSNSHDVQFTSASYGDLILRSGSVWINTKQLSGSYAITGSLTADSFTGDLVGTASYATTASYAISASHEITFELSSSHAEVADEVPFTGITGKPTLVSSSIQIGSDISGSFTATSASIASDISDIIDGTTTITSASHALTASYALNAGGGTGVGFPFSGSAIITGSLFVSGSTISGSFVGDGSGLTGIDVGAIASVSQTFTNVTSSIVSHNFNSKDVNVAVYNGSDQYIIPDTITLTDNNTVTVLFAVPTSGRIVVSKGGHILSGLGLTSKAGCILTSSFSPTGSSFYYDVNFTSNFDTTNYSVTLQAHSQFAVPDSFPGHAWVDSNKSTSGFRIVVPSFDDTMDEICWTAIAHGESDVTASHSQTSTTASHALSALTASYALNAGAGAGFPYSGSAIITGSLIVSSSIVDFTQATAISGSLFSGSFFGDGTGLSGLGYGDTKKLNQTVAATTWSFSHNMNEQYPTVTVYNSVNEVIQPSKIEAVDAQTLRLYFGIPVAGTAVAVVGGVALTQEAGFNRVLTQTVAATTWSFEHNLGNKYPQVAVYDASDELVIPGKLEAIDQNNLTIYFDTPQAGTATATVGGTSLTASYANSLVITDTLLTTQENTDVDTGTETVATVSTTLYDGAFFDYVLKDGTNYRAGTVSAVWDGSSVQFSEISTADIGNTNSVTMSVDISGTDARLRATVGSDNWNIKAFVRAL